VSTWLDHHGVASDRPLARATADRIAADLNLPLPAVQQISAELVAAASAQHEQSGAAFATTLQQLRTTPASVRRPAVLSQLAARANSSEAALVDRLRSELATARSQIGAALEQTPAGDVPGINAQCQKWSAQVDALLVELDRRVATELGPAPAGADGHPITYLPYAVGSFGRRELSFYSDVDFGILIEQDTPAVRDYFKRYSDRIGQLLHAIEGDGGIHPCPDLSPNGLLGAALVDTPEQLAQRLVGRSDDMAQRTLRDQVCIQSALSAARPLATGGAGSALYDRFAATAERALGPTPPQLATDSGRRAALERVGMGLRDPFGVPDEVAHWNQVPGDGVDSGTAARAAAKKFVPLTPDQALAAGRVNIKHDLLRAMQIPLQALHLLFATRSAAGDDVLAELDQRGLIDHHFADKLRETLAACLRYRLLNDRRAGRSEPQLLEVTERDRRAIRRMVPLLYRLRQGMQALSTGDPNTFALK